MSHRVFGVIFHATRRRWCYIELMSHIWCLARGVNSLYILPLAKDAQKQVLLDEIMKLTRSVMITRYAIMTCVINTICSRGDLHTTGSHCILPLHLNDIWRPGVEFVWLAAPLDKIFSISVSSTSSFQHFLHDVNFVCLFHLLIFLFVKRAFYILTVVICEVAMVKIS